MLILGIDPGISTGWCLLGPDFIRAGILKEQDWPQLWAANYVVIEKPNIYRGHPRPNDLITLALSAGEIAGKYKSQAQGAVKYIWPADWKHQLPKDICWKRVCNLLTPSEVEQLDGIESLRHDARDAVGIALFAQGRKVF